MKILNCLEGPVLTLISGDNEKLPEHFVELNYEVRFIIIYNILLYQYLRIIYLTYF